MELMGEVGSETVMVDYAHNPAGVETTLHELSKLYDRIAVVITVSSESGHEGDLDILDSALGNVKYIIPASPASNVAAKEIIENAKDNNYKGEYTYEELSEIFVFPDEAPEESNLTNSNAGTNAKGVMDGFKTALKTDVDLVICIGEAAFKFDDTIREYCKTH